MGVRRSRQVDDTEGRCRGSTGICLLSMLIPYFICEDGGPRTRSRLLFTSKTSACQIVFALLATLRTTTTTTATTSPQSKATTAAKAAGATGGGSSSTGYSLAALLNLFLNSCCYIIAFASLLVLIIYLNHTYAIQFTKEANKREPVMTVTTSDNGINLRVNESSKIGHVIVKRSPSNDQAPQQALTRAISPKAQNIGQMTTTSSSQSSSTTRTDRQLPVEINETRWIPIVGNGRFSQRSPKAASIEQSIDATSGNKQHVSMQAPILAIKPNTYKPINPTRAPPFASTQRTQTTGRTQPDRRKQHQQFQPDGLLTQHSYHYNNYMPFRHARPNYHWQPRYRWRKPRLHSGYDSLQAMQSKIYKRVLLCDKTLVSLDYVRSFPLPVPVPVPVPIPMTHLENEFDNNFIDFDTSFENFLADKRISDSVSIETRPNVTNPAYDLSDFDGAATNIEKRTSGSKLERRSLMNDELIRCDMWDLEKGLKNRKPPEEILRQAMRADFETVLDAIKMCRHLSEKSLAPEDDHRDRIELMSTEDLMSLFSMKRGLIPGTKWCGLGDQASSYNDLGQKHRIDICCRAHDHCPIRLKPFRNDYGVFNFGVSTKSHCTCDADFYQCLRDARSRTADLIGNVYFNVMKLQCLIPEERVKVCRETKPVSISFERCTKTVFRFTTPPVAY